MQPFEFVEHTADIAVAAEGRDLRELCENAAQGLLHAIADVSALSPTSEHHIHVQADEPERLLHALLREIHYLHDTHDLLFTDVQVTRCEHGRLDATLKAAALAGNEAHVLADIKAVTYHGLEIEEFDKGTLRVQVVFDI
jgi:SHS2 domain-containing protein